MSDRNPAFGLRKPDMVYLERPGAYAVIRGADDRQAFVSGKGGRIFLPVSGLRPDEPPEDALRREIIEETGWRAHILDRTGDPVRGGRGRGLPRHSGDLFPSPDDRAGHDRLRARDRVAAGRERDGLAGSRERCMGDFVDRRPRRYSALEQT